MTKQGETISVTEAHQRFGDLARIRNGVTTWIDVEAEGGTWCPVFNGDFGIGELSGYMFFRDGENRG